MGNGIGVDLRDMLGRWGVCSEQAPVACCLNVAMNFRSLAARSLLLSPALLTDESGSQKYFRNVISLPLRLFATHNTCSCHTIVLSAFGFFHFKVDPKCVKALDISDLVSTNHTHSEALANTYVRHIIHFVLCL